MYPRRCPWRQRGPCLAEETEGYMGGLLPLPDAAAVRTPVTSWRLGVVPSPMCRPILSDVPRLLPAPSYAGRVIYRDRLNAYGGVRFHRYDPAGHVHAYHLRRSRRGFPLPFTPAGAADLWTCFSTTG
jgi:hypothetical protein